MQFVCDGAIKRSNSSLGLDGWFTVKRQNLRRNLDSEAYDGNKDMTSIIVTGFAKTLQLRTNVNI